MDEACGHVVRDALVDFQRRTFDQFLDGAGCGKKVQTDIQAPQFHEPATARDLPIGPNEVCEHASAGEYELNRIIAALDQRIDSVQNFLLLINVGPLRKALELVEMDDQSLPAVQFAMNILPYKVLLLIPHEGVAELRQKIAPQLLQRAGTRSKDRDQAVA